LLAQPAKHHAVGESAVQRAHETEVLDGISEHSRSLMTSSVFVTGAGMRGWDA
jgi:hypothetical protein